MTTPDPPAYEAAVRAHLAGTEEQFNHQAMLATFLGTERFGRVAALAARSATIEDARFLSSGCGMGGSLVAFHDAGAATVTGVEVDADSVRLASLRVEDIPGASVHRIEPTAPLPLPDDSVDLVESLDVIEHVQDPVRYLGDLARVLAPGGTILLSTPNRLWPVEQHLDIVGPPWLPVDIADALWDGLARLPGLSDDRRFRWSRLRGMRTQNLGLRRLQRLAAANGLHLRLVVEESAQLGTFPPDPVWQRRLLEHRVGRYLSPVRHLVAVLTAR